MYPEPESTSAALISAIPDAWGFIVIELVQAIVNGFEDVSLNIHLKLQTYLFGNRILAKYSSNDCWNIHCWMC